MHWVVIFARIAIELQRPTKHALRFPISHDRDVVCTIYQHTTTASRQTTAVIVHAHVQTKTGATTLPARRTELTKPVCEHMCWSLFNIRKISYSSNSLAERANVARPLQCHWTLLPLQPRTETANIPKFHILNRQSTVCVIKCVISATDQYIDCVTRVAVTIATCSNNIDGGTHVTRI